MIFSRAVPVAIAFATAVAAQSPTATVVISAAQSGPKDLVNTTISIQLGTLYTNPTLDAVSTLYLTGASGVPVDSVTCTPYPGTNGTGVGGKPFNITTPSLLSTNTVVVGSIVCLSSPPEADSSSAATSSSTSATGSASVATPYGNGTTTTTALPGTVTSSSGTATNPTSIFLTTVPAPGGSVTQSTITSVVVAGGSPSSRSTSVTTSASPSLGTSNAAAQMPLGDGLVRGAMIAGLGLLAVV